MERSLVVVGAGVIGLTVAIRLAESGWQVLVLAREMPLETTSAKAAAIWYPYRIRPHERALAWAERSLAEFTALASDPTSGVVLRPGIEYLRKPSRAPWWGSLVPSLARPAAVPKPYRDGWSFTAPIVEMPVYLTWLQRRLESLGGTLHRVDLEALPQDAPLVVNCSGLGARTLVGDRAMSPVRGQTLRMSQPGIDTWSLDSAGLTYVIPRSSDVVVGGTDEEDSWDTAPNPTVAAHILGRAAALDPRLRDAHVLSHQVGLRPARPRARLEVQRLPGERRVVHCYGHGGAGVTVSWGCADEVASLARGLRESSGIPARKS